MNQVRKLFLSVLNCRHPITVCRKSRLPTTLLVDIFCSSFLRDWLLFLKGFPLIFRYGQQNVDWNFIR